MKLQQQLSKAVYPGNVISLLAVITLTGTFLSPLVTDADVHDGFRMRKIFLFRAGDAVCYSGGNGSFYQGVETAGGFAYHISKFKFFTNVV